MGSGCGRRSRRGWWPVLEEYLSFLKRQEGLRLTPYRDQVGLPTIGYGHRIPSLNVPPITEARADQMLREDAEHAESQALLLAPNLLAHPKPLAALTDLCFNVGPQALKGTGTLAAFRRGDWKDAAARYVKWDKAHDPRGNLVVLPVLARRRALMASWIA